MNIKDALGTFQIGKKKVAPQKLLTSWGEKLDPNRVLNEYPRPQMRRKSYKNLNGWWEYAICRNSGEPAEYDGRILVPFSPEALLSGVGRQLLPDEYLWYRRNFHADKPAGRSRLFLNFGAIDEEATVFLNGRKICDHSGGYLPFSAEITSAVLTGDNTLTVRVKDLSDTSWRSRGKQKLKPGGMFYTAQSGIWQTVWLEEVPEIYIRDLKITPLFDAESIEITVRTSAPVPVFITLGDRTAETRPDIPCRLPVPDMHAWSPEDPYLYSFSVNAGKDRVGSYFAMRKYSVGKDSRGISRLFLNNRPYFENGVLDQGYWSDGLYTAPSDEALIYDIKAMKNLGFNMLRKHIKIEPLRWYYHCDRLGMIVWQDIPNGGGRSLMTFLLYLPTALPFVTSHFPDNNYPLFSRTSREGRHVWLKECCETMQLLYNCPCIGLWTAFNEGWGQFDALKVAAKMKTWDPTRPVDHASGWYDQGGGDVRTVHNYFRNFRIETGRRPFCFSEYGGLSRHIDGHSYSTEDFAYTRYDSRDSLRTAFRELMEKIAGLKEKGLAAAVYTQVSDVEEEVNGILTFDRKVNKLD